MAGFRHPDEILADLKGSPALRPWLQAASTNPTLAALTRFPLEADASLRTAMAEGYCAESHDAPHAEQFRILQEKYPGDCGVFFALLLNLFTIHPGEAVYIQANTPHAYLKGRGIECMANSDNVIRAGLTSKYVNRSLLMETLEFTPRTPDALRTPASRGEFDFACGEDFRLRVVQNAPIRREGNTPGVFIVIQGSAEVTSGDQHLHVLRGSAWFAPASAPELLIIPSENALIAWAEA